MTERHEMAFYDATKNRVTPWFPVGPWTVDEATADVTVHYAAFRGDPFQGYFPISFTMTKPGATATVVFTADQYDQIRQLRDLMAGDTN